MYKGNRIFTTLVIGFSALALILVSCKKEKPVEEEFGKLRVEFLHYYDGEPVVYDSLVYYNEAGNLLMINEIQYFISDVTLKSSSGSKMIKDWTDIYYVDIDIPATLTWNVYDKIPIGSYSGLSFVFGIPASKNTPYMYVNPPERDMFWPFYLGGPNGGYHYLKLNGKYLQMPENQVSPFNFHLGVGQIYASGVVDVDSITGYIQNYFTVDFPTTSYKVENQKTTVIKVVMNIEEWFKNPNVFDINTMGAFIMQNQDAMGAASENGHNVFSIKEIKVQ